MSELQAVMGQVYMLPEKDQHTLAGIIRNFLAKIMEKQDNGEPRPIGKYDGKYEFVEDIDFCNDEIAEMFGVANE